MREYQPDNNRKGWLITLSILGILIIGVGIVLYYNFFRQNNALLIETVPDNAAFVLEINDNVSFVKSTMALDDYLKELLSFDAFAGLQSFWDQSKATEESSAIISGHLKEDHVFLLFSTRMEERTFKELLKSLHIDARNCQSFENTQIYSYGTHYKKFNFVFHNNIFTVCENIDLLKQSIARLRNPHNMLSNKQFKKIYSLTEKNTKQNWLLINHEVYTDIMLSYVNEKYQNTFMKLKSMASWSAYQIRFTDKEIHLDGYTLASSPFLQKFEGQIAGTELPSDIVPFDADFYLNIQTPEVDIFTKNISKYYNGEFQAIETWNKLKPTANYLFSLSPDSTTYYYFAIPADSLKLNIEQLCAADQTPDSVQHYKQFDIYKAGLHNMGIILSALHIPADLTYFTEYHGYYIFAKNTEAMQCYYTMILKNTILNNPCYKVSKTNMPSDCNVELFYHNNQDSEKSAKFFSQGHQQSMLKQVKVFTCSISAPVNGLATTNIYIKF